MATSKNTFIPKSLHTITALSNVARHLMGRIPAYSPGGAVEEAAYILGLAEKDDIYGLKAAALKTLEKASGPVSGLAGDGAVASASVN